MASTTKKSAGPESRERRSFEEMGKSASQVIQEAAAILEEELAVGIVAAKKVTRRLADEQRIDSEDFAESLKRFRSLGAQLIETSRQRLDDLRLDSTHELMNRYLNDASGAFELFADLIEMSPKLANRVLEPRRSRSSRQKSPARKKHKKAQSKT